MKKITFFYLVLFIVFETGCSLQASLKKRTNTVGSTIPESMELVLGSAQTALTVPGGPYPGGYKVESTFGHYLPEIKHTVNGYTVYSTVQGVLISQ